MLKTQCHHNMIICWNCYFQYFPSKIIIIWHCEIVKILSIPPDWNFSLWTLAPHSVLPVYIPPSRLSSWLRFHSDQCARCEWSGNLPPWSHHLPGPHTLTTVDHSPVLYFTRTSCKLTLMHLARGLLHLEYTMLGRFENLAFLLLRNCSCCFRV